MLCNQGQVVHHQSIQLRLIKACTFTKSCSSIPATWRTGSYRPSSLRLTSKREQDMQTSITVPTASEILNPKPLDKGSWQLDAATSNMYMRVYLLCKVEACVVCNKKPTDGSTRQRKGPCDPKLVAVAQVVEPDNNQYGPNFACGGRNAMCCTPDLGRIHLHKHRIG